jgi:hypothetical protein
MGHRLCSRNVQGASAGAWKSWAGHAPLPRKPWLAPSQEAIPLGIFLSSLVCLSLVPLWDMEGRERGRAAGQVPSLPPWLQG